MSLIEKIDALPWTIADSETMDELISRKSVKTILSEQKQPLTIGDKIRESNESLAEAMNIFKYGVSGNPFTLNTIMGHLNQPYTIQSTISPHQNTAK